MKPQQQIQIQNAGKHLQKSGTNPQQEAGLSNYLFGKVQPQAIPLEEAVLGALMLDRDALLAVMDILRPETFYLETHQVIYRAIIRLFERSNPVDLLTVTEELRKSGELEKAGGGYYLVELANRIASAANIEYHARIIAQKHIQRELIRVSTQTIQYAYEDTIDVFNLLDMTEKGFFEITQNNMSRAHENLASLGAKVLHEIGLLSQKKEGLIGIPSGFTDLDRLTSGWQSSDLIIMAARPGMGKSSLALAFALNAAKDFGKPVAFFTLEMAGTQLMQRLMSMDGEIPAFKLRNGKMNEDEWTRLQITVEQLSAVPIYIDDTPAINIFELRSKCRRLKQKHGIQMVIIDYLQLMTGATDNNSKSGNREQEIAGISRSLKALAKELQIPVIALAQLSRAVETRGGARRPQLSDLRESGSIEADADIVSFIYRPEYYQILQDENGQSLKGIAEFIIAKHRNGALDTVQMRFTDEFAKFSNLDDFNADTFFDRNVANMTTKELPLQTESPAFHQPIPRIKEEDIPF